MKPKHERTSPVPAYTPTVAAHRADATPGSRPAGVASNPPEPTLSWQEAELVKEFDRDHQQRKGESNAARNLQAITRGKQVRDQRSSPAAASELG